MKRASTSGVNTGQRHAGLAAIFIAFLALLGGCGGGGDGGPAQEPLSITEQPASIGMLVGTSAALKVAAAGDSPTYQWERSADGGLTWTAIAGETAATLRISSASAATDQHQYRALVSDAEGDLVASVAATLSVTTAVEAPVIVVQPDHQQVSVGGESAYAVTASGTSLTYRWQASTNGAEWADIPGAEKATLQLGAATRNDGMKSVRVLVRNAVAEVASDAALLVVEEAADPSAVEDAPAPTREGSDEKFGAGSNAESAIGSEAQGIEAATPPVAEMVAGTPVVTARPLSTTVVAPQRAKFTVTARGTAPLAYQWQRSTDRGVTYTNIALATGTSYTTPATRLSQSGWRFRVRVSNSVGHLTSGAAVLTVKATAQAPAIVTQPKDISVSVPTKATFFVVTSGAPSPAYQWQVSVNSGARYTNITGATGYRYTTPATRASDNSRRYRVVVRNSAGSVISRAAKLTVIEPDTPPSGGPCWRSVALLPAGTTIRSVTLNTNGIQNTQTARVVGPRQFRGYLATRIDTAGTSGAASLRASEYVSASGASGAVTLYGATTHTSSSFPGYSVVSDAELTYTPPYVDAHLGLDVGESVTQTYTQDLRATGTVNGVAIPPTHKVETDTDTWKLIGIESVTVPAGTFRTCRFTNRSTASSGTMTSWTTVNQGIEVKSSDAAGTMTALSVLLNGVPLR